MEGQLRMLRPTSAIWCWWASFSRVTQAESQIRGQGTAYIYSSSEVIGGRRKDRSSLLKREVFFFFKFSKSFEPLR